MSTINIYDLRPTGTEFFSDSESYMSELGDNEFEMINGGATPTIIVSISARASAASSMRCLNASIKLTQRDPGQAGGLSHAISQISRLIF